jgi:hypothetical protein
MLSNGPTCELPRAIVPAGAALSTPWAPCVLVETVPQLSERIEEEAQEIVYI